MPSLLRLHHTAQADVGLRRHHILYYGINDKTPCATNAANAPHHQSLSDFLFGMRRPATNKHPWSHPHGQCPCNTGTSRRESRGGRASRKVSNTALPVPSHVLSTSTEPNTYAMLKMYVTPCHRKKENPKLPYDDDDVDDDDDDQSWPSYSQQSCAASVRPISSPILLSVGRRRTCRWLLRIQHLEVHALNRRNSHSGPRPVVVDCVTPAAC